MAMMNKNPFSLPDGSYRTVPADSMTATRVLKEENLRYHEAAWGLKSPVVMAGFVRTTGGHRSGDHDGLRDGYAPARQEFMRLYSSLEEWIAAGNKDPRSA